MKWSLVQRGLFFVCRGGPNAYIMQLKFMGWAYKKEAAAQFICATAPYLLRFLLSLLFNLSIFSSRSAIAEA